MGFAALYPSYRNLHQSKKDVDGRDKPGHDEIFTQTVSYAIR
jgi:hypothetical protein